MYELLYRLLPGGRVAKVIQLILLAGIVLALLIFVIFPMVDSLIPQEPAINE